MVSIEEFGAIDLRVGKIIEVQDLENARKPIYRLKVDLGELGIKNIALGLKDYYSKEDLTNKYVVVVSNMNPKSVAGFVSEGMLLAAQDGDKIALITVDKSLSPGSKVT